MGRKVDAREGLNRTGKSKEEETERWGPSLPLSREIERNRREREQREWERRERETPELFHSIFFTFF